VTIKQQQLRTPSPNPKKKKTQNGVIKGQKEQIMPQELPPLPPITSKKRIYIKKYRKMFFFLSSFDEQLLERLVTKCPLFLEPRGHLVGAGWTPTKSSVMLTIIIKGKPRKSFGFFLYRKNSIALLGGFSSWKI